MKTNIEPLLPNVFYHIYNRSVGNDNIFWEEKNYAYFLSKYSQFIEPIAETYAYCLLKNHFHLLVRIRDEQEIKQNLFSNTTQAFSQKPISWLLSNCFASFFKSYTQSINKMYERKGKLFEVPFRRIAVHNDAYLTALIYYIHHNPQKHGFVTNFRDYPYSSYHSHLHTAKTKLKREEVIQWFGGKNEYEQYHLSNLIIENLHQFEIEIN